jgi:beta-lactamase class A
MKRITSGRGSVGVLVLAALFALLIATSLLAPASANSAPTPANAQGNAPYPGHSDSPSLMARLRANRATGVTAAASAKESTTSEASPSEASIASAAPEPAPAVASSSMASNQSLEEIISSTVNSQPGTWAVYVRNLNTGEEAAINADTQMNVASLYKLQVLYATYALERAGQVSLDESLPEGWTVSGALYDMITVSDQGATFALLRRLGTDNVNAVMSGLGLGQSYITDWGYSTARETGTLLEMIALGQAVDEAASKNMLTLLFDQQINDRLPANLPAGIVAHKTGELPGERNDAGIIYGPNGPYVMVVVTNDVPDEDAASNAIAALSGQVYEYFSR